ncbi:S41 family peptidase [Pseudoalteromonas sp. Hal099]
MALQVAALKMIIARTLKGLVIDLRDSLGGTLQSAVAVADLFYKAAL